MMVEGGKIDWACHANDAASSIHDTLAPGRTPWTRLSSLRPPTPTKR